MFRPFQLEIFHDNCFHYGSFFSLIFQVWIFHLSFPASVFTSDAISFAPGFRDKFFSPISFNIILKCTLIIHSLSNWEFSPRFYLYNFFFYRHSFLDHFWLTIFFLQSLSPTLIFFTQIFLLQFFPDVHLFFNYSPTNDFSYQFPLYYFFPLCIYFSPIFQLKLFHLNFTPTIFFTIFKFFLPGFWLRIFQPTSAKKKKDKAQKIFRHELFMCQCGCWGWRRIKFF